MTTERHLPAAVADHLENMRLRGLTARTIYARERALARLAEWLEARENPPPGGLLRSSGGGPGCPSVALLGASAQDLAAWRASLAVGDLAVASYVSHVQNFYAWCVTAGLLGSNPAAGLPVPRRGRRLPRPIGDDDLFAALAAAPRRIRLMIVLAAWCGLRAKELALLRRENILDTARPPFLLVAGDATKGRTERAVPLSSFVLEELALAGLPSGGWIFPRKDGRPGPLEPWRVSHLVNRHLHRLGIRHTLHSLRHWFLTGAWRQTHDLRLVQELAGHASPVTTAGYTLTDQPSAAAAVEGLPVPARLRVAR